VSPPSVSHSRRLKRPCLIRSAAPSPRAGLPSEKVSLQGHPPFGGSTLIPANHTAADDYLGSDCVGVIALVLVVLVLVLVQGKWTSMDSWFVAVFALAVTAMVIGHYVNQMRLLVPA
jgi:hypothetical protein